MSMNIRIRIVMGKQNCPKESCHTIVTSFGGEKVDELIWRCGEGGGGSLLNSPWEICFRLASFQVS